MDEMDLIEAGLVVSVCHFNVQVCDAVTAAHHLWPHVRYALGSKIDAPFLGHSQQINFYSVNFFHFCSSANKYEVLLSVLLDILHKNKDYIVMR